MPHIKDFQVNVYYIGEHIESLLSEGTFKQCKIIVFAFFPPIAERRRLWLWDIGSDSGERACRKVCKHSALRTSLRKDPVHPGDFPSKRHRSTVSPSRSSIRSRSSAAAHKRAPALFVEFDFISLFCSKETVRFIMLPPCVNLCRVEEKYIHLYTVWSILLNP